MNIKPRLDISNENDELYSTRNMRYLLIFLHESNIVVKETNAQTCMMHKGHGIFTFLMEVRDADSAC